MLNAIAKPFGVLLLWLYKFTTNYGVAILLFALIVRILLLFFSAKSKRGTLKTARLQPLMDELKKKHGANQQKYNEEVAKLYREYKIKPMSGCLWTLIPFPILLALYQAIRYPLTIMMGVPAALLEKGGAIYNMLTVKGFEAKLNGAYSQIEQSQFITDNWENFKGLSEKLVAVDYSFLGLDLGAVPEWKLWEVDWSSLNGAGEYWQVIGLFMMPIISAVFSYMTSWVMKKLQPSNAVAQQQGSTMKMMTFLMPVMSLWIGYAMPAGLCLYWIAGSILGMVQDIILTKYYNKKLDAEDAVINAAIREKQAELEAKRAETERLRAENATKENPNTSKKKKQQQDREEQSRKQLEYEKAKNPEKHQDKPEPSRVGDRRYARGRAYDPDRFKKGHVASEPDELDEPLVEEEALVEEEMIAEEEAVVEVEAVEAEEIGEDEAEK